MQCLKINSGKGEFSFDGTNFKALDEINKDDILKLLDLALDSDTDFQMDEYDAESFTNPAHKVIYANLYTKFADLVSTKEQFIDEVNDLYKESYEKYKIMDVPSETDSSSGS